MAEKSVLIVEDERIVAEDMKETLKNFGYYVPAISISGELAIEKAEQYHPDIVLMDIFLAGEMNGIEAAAQIRQRFHIPVIYLTAYADKQIMEKAKITEPYGYILKPYDERELHTAIEIALYRHEMYTKLTESEERYRGFVQNFLGIAFRLHPDFSPVFYHGAVERITGYSEDELKAGSPAWNEIVHPDDLSLFTSQNEKIRAVPTYSAEREYRITKKDGQIRWVHELIQHIPGPSKEGSYVQGTLYDVTDRILAEEGIKKRDAILVAVGFAVEWFLKAPLEVPQKDGEHKWGGETDVRAILENVGLTVGVTDIAMFQIKSGDDKNPAMSIRHEWDARGTGAFLHKPRYKAYPLADAGLLRWYDLFKKGSNIAGNIGDFPEPEQGFLALHGFQTAVMIPIAQKDTFWGFIGFFDANQRGWSKEEIEGLQIVTNIVSLMVAYREQK